MPSDEQWAAIRVMLWDVLRLAGVLVGLLFAYAVLYVNGLVVEHILLQIPGAHDPQVGSTGRLVYYPMIGALPFLLLVLGYDYVGSWYQSARERADVEGGESGE